jgi:hypothetical protein
VVILKEFQGDVTDVRFRPKADISYCVANVCFRGKSGHWSKAAAAAGGCVTTTSPTTLKIKDNFD